MALLGPSLAFRLLPPEVLDRWNAVALLALSGVVLTLTLTLTLTLSLPTDHTSAGSQAFCALPVLWAAIHLRTPGVVLVTAAALASDLLTLVLPLPLAVTDSTFFGAVLAVLLVRANRGQEGWWRPCDARSPPTC